MEKKFLKNNWAILVAYVGFIMYLATGFGTNNPYLKISETIHDYSYISLILLFIQTIIWKNVKDKSFIKNKILSISSLLIINFYFFCDFYLFFTVRNFIRIETIGILLNGLSFISGIILIIQSIAWVIIEIKASFKFFKLKNSENK